MKKRVLPFWYNEYKNLIEKSIDNYLGNYFLSSKSSLACEEFSEVIKYSVKGGKKIRSILALEFYLILTFKDIKEISQDDDILKVCIAIELLHAYSLIHDDLPCMDNDELRRGQPTVWKKYGEYRGVLAGDLLNSLAFEVLSEIKDADVSRKIIREISRSVGFYGMIGGQLDDLFFEENKDKLDQFKLIDLHNKKTGALIKASIKSGIIMASKEKYLSIFESFGEKLGLAFQIKDDILDVEGTKEETGKSVGGEQKGFVYFNGLKKSKEKLKDLVKNCLELSKTLNSEKLNFITNYVGERGK